MQSLRIKLAVGVAALGVAGVGTAAIAHDRARYDAFLTGYEEPPAISTSANGAFKAQISRGEDEIHYSLVYTGQFNPGTTTPTTVTQAHIHIGQLSVNGGISVWLCGSATNQPAPTVPKPPDCPAAGVPVTGTLTPAHVVGPGGQGIQAGEFAELVRALRAGVAYANVHTTTHPGGEIRGQISDDRGRGHGH